MARWEGGSYECIGGSWMLVVVDGVGWPMRRVRAWGVDENMVIAYKLERRLSKIVQEAENRGL